MSVIRERERSNLPYIYSTVILPTTQLFELIVKWKSYRRRERERNFVNIFLNPVRELSINIIESFKIVARLDFNGATSSSSSSLIND